MKRLFNSLAVFVGIWLLGSFLGVMLDAAHKNLWTQSLMWALLSCVILAPVFIFVGTSDATPSSPPSAEAEPFETDDSLEIQDRDSSADQEGWPYTSEEESGSDSPGAVRSNN
jgi:hypothetical protein